MHRKIEESKMYSCLSLKAFYGQEKKNMSLLVNFPSLLEAEFPPAAPHVTFCVVIPIITSTLLDDSDYWTKKMKIVLNFITFGWNTWRK